MIVVLVVHCFSLFIKVCPRLYCYCSTFVTQLFFGLNHGPLCSLIRSCVFDVVKVGPTFAFHIPFSKALLHNHLAYMLFLSTCLPFTDGLQIRASKCPPNVFGLNHNQACVGLPPFSSTSAITSVITYNCDFFCFN